MRTQEDRSVGIVVYRGTPRKYLILFKFGRTDFPKGHAEVGESDEDAARRELKEETGIANITLHKGFVHETAYTFTHNRVRIKKRVPHFLGKTTQREVTISKEHEGYVWLTYSDAIKLLSFKNQKELLEKAETFLGA